ncbi:adenosylcobinamide-GDP ribazoletransferase [Paenibacillus crassostreae]|uniref:Adenosylcobinamide-GDP ribazoletransferase n=1 Tax=Paenibacillus crassostreae TaxID=1763538 RepID=A0A162N0S1_9BACL|nr:adenosylcobinamide-GDP ribazoletransferase [Paenibacillus crassostreae]AOZ92138.1 cobalamin 5'-phosphate synthase [Paenibacillus crassostreae]OAB77599.1 cobalamin synthase [Paenibacillus crassostreae]
MRNWIQAAAAAFQFLSRFPVRANLDYSDTLFRQSVKFYPLVGAAIGLVVWIAALGFTFLLPPLPAAVLILILWVGLTGGLHLDGWMDTADGILSYRPREQILEIMKDSRVGAMGVLACVLLLMLKLSLIYSLIVDGLDCSGLLLLPLIWSRWFMVHAMSSWPKARGKDGLAGKFIGLDKAQIGATLVIALVLSGVVASIAPLIMMDRYTWTIALLGWVTLPLSVWATGMWVARKMNATLGGLTGDTYGALNELLEVVALLMLVLLYNHL